MGPGERLDVYHSSRHLRLSLLYFYYDYRLIHRLVIVSVYKQRIDYWYGKSADTLIAILPSHSPEVYKHFCRPRSLHQYPETSSGFQLQVRDAFKEAELPHIHRVDMPI